MTINDNKNKYNEKLNILVHQRGHSKRIRWIWRWAGNSETFMKNQDHWKNLELIAQGSDLKDINSGGVKWDDKEVSRVDVTLTDEKNFTIFLQNIKDNNNCFIF